MSSATNFVLTIKNNQDNYVPLYPKTTTNQALGWEGQEIYGPFVLELNSANWENNQQSFAVDGVLSTDIVKCNKVLEGTQEEMLKQQNAYNLLDQLRGIESLDGEVKFTAIETPESSVKVQIYWTR